MSGWIRITEVENIPPGEGRPVRLDGHDVALFHVNGGFKAVENRCPHQGGPLADGIVSSMDGVTTVTCPLHAWRVCLETGAVRKPAGQGGACVRSFETKVEDGVVLVRLQTLAEAA